MELILEIEKLLIRARRQVGVAAMTEASADARKHLQDAHASLRRAIDSTGEASERIWSGTSRRQAPTFETEVVQAKAEAEQPRVCGLGG